MMRRLLAGAALVLVGAALVLVGASRVDAQASAGMISAVGRARSMVDGGDGTAARALLDSLVARAAPSSDDLAEALYWRAVLSERVADGERDWKQLVVDAPLSPRVPESLLRLGELEILRGRPAVARAHFERLLLDFPESAQRPKAMVWIVRSFFEERDFTRGWEMVRTVQADTVPEGEMRLQVDELQLRCAVSGTSTAVGGTSTAVGGSATAVGGTSTAVVPTTAVPTTAVPTTAVFSVQLAAYDTRAQANALVTRLAKRGLKARVDGDRKPFRVRVGRYDTRADAAVMLARLKKQGQGGFVTELGK